ncbi:hypothetical protein HDV57DRAFT_192691 [Trichoderma longibrachiatum]
MAWPRQYCPQQPKARYNGWQKRQLAQANALPFSSSSFSLSCHFSLDGADGHDSRGCWELLCGARDPGRLLMIPAILEAYLHQPFSSLQKRVTMSAVDELPFDIPQITSDELLAFQQSHFSNEAAAEFGHTFTSLPPQATSEHQPCEDWWEEEEDDGLGYYEDGVKRTLTDAQIAIFRHSEIRELRRQQEKQAGSKAPELPQDVSAKDMGTASPQDGGGTVGSQSKKRKRKKPKAVKQEPKPDLRKRTWDVVEAGLDSLDYD